jgi:hypothetical protein
MAAKKKKTPSEAGKTPRTIALIERLLERNELRRSTTKVTKEDLAELEAAEGRPLPAAYVAIMNRIGAIGRRIPEGQWGGWEGAHRNIYGPKDAAWLTNKLRDEYGKEGRHAAYVNRTLFCVHWMLKFEFIGVDDEGKVRVLRSGRPGTMLRVAANSLEEYLLSLLGDLSTVSSDDVTDDLDPSTLTDLEISEDEQLRTLARLNKTMKNLERLTLVGVDQEAWLAPLGKHPTLREIHLWGGDVKTLPDALFLAPKLEKIDFRRTDAAKTYGNGLSGVLSWFHTDAIPPQKRALYVRLLGDDETWLTNKSNASDEDLLSALDAPNDRIAEVAHRILAGRLTPPKSLAKARVAIVGRPHSMKANILASQLEKAGATLEKKIENASHVLIGLRPQGAHEKRKKGVPLVHEQHLRTQLDAKGARKGSDAKKVLPLLQSLDKKKIATAIGMMQAGGVPTAPGVLEAILLVMQFPKMDAKLRKSLEKLATEVMPDFTRVVREVLGGTNIYKCGATKLSDRFAALDKKSKGKISGRILCLEMLRAPDEDNLSHDEEEEFWGICQQPLLYAFETGDADFALEAIEIARKGKALDLGGLEARLGAAIDKNPNALPKAKGIERISFTWTYMREVPKCIAKLTNLRALSFEENDLKTLPDAMSALKKLEVLNISDNRMNAIPKAVFGMTALKKLSMMNQGTPKPRLRSIPDEIASLKNLEEIHLMGAKLPTLPDALLDLPKLKLIDLEDAQVADLPKNLKTKDPKQLRKLRDGFRKKSAS